jgi:hypothetical protein
VVVGALKKNLTVKRDEFLLACSLERPRERLRDIPRVVLGVVKEMVRI